MQSLFTSMDSWHQAIYFCISCNQCTGVVISRVLFVIIGILKIKTDVALVQVIFHKEHTLDITELYDMSVDRLL